MNYWHHGPLSQAINSSGLTSGIDPQTGVSQAWMQLAQIGIGVLQAASYTRNLHLGGNAIIRSAVEQSLYDVEALAAEMSVQGGRTISRLAISCLIRCLRTRWAVSRSNWSYMAWIHSARSVAYGNLAPVQKWRLVNCCKYFDYIVITSLSESSGNRARSPVRWGKKAV